MSYVVWEQCLTVISYWQESTHQWWFEEHPVEPSFVATPFCWQQISDLIFITMWDDLPNVWLGCFNMFVFFILCTVRNEERTCRWESSSSCWDLSFLYKDSFGPLGKVLVFWMNEWLFKDTLAQEFISYWVSEKRYLVSSVCLCVYVRAFMRACEARQSTNKTKF